MICQECKRAVRRLAREMRRLKANEHKGGWDQMGKLQLMLRIMDEYDELRKAPPTIRRTQMPSSRSAPTWPTSP